MCNHLHLIGLKEQNLPVQQKITTKNIPISNIWVGLQGKKQNGAGITGNFSRDHSLTYLTWALNIYFPLFSVCRFCFPNMVEIDNSFKMRVFPGMKLTNDKLHILCNSVADWMLWFCRANSSLASRRSTISPSSASLYIASSCCFSIKPLVSSSFVIHHAWCRQLYCEEWRPW